MQSLLEGIKFQAPAGGPRQLTSLAREGYCVHSDTAGSPNFYTAEQAGKTLATSKESIV